MVGLLGVNRVADRRTDESTSARQRSAPARLGAPTDTGATGTDGLTVVCGLPGVGKTTVARRIADDASADVLRTDAIRKELFEDPTYADDETRTVYTELLSRARDRLARGEPVVLDATFTKATFRQDAVDLADELGVPFRLVHVDCATEVVRDRIQRREGLSDADFDVHLLIKAEFEPLEGEYLTVDNSGSQAETAAQVDELFRPPSARTR